MKHLELASPELQTTLLTFINEQRLPRPLSHTTVHVTVALEALWWRGSKNNDVGPVASQGDGVPA